MSEMPPIPEKISSKKIIVYKSRVDPTIVKLTAEKMKAKLFSKRRSEDIRVVSVDKYYEPYVLIDAKYRREFFRLMLILTLRTSRLAVFRTSLRLWMLLGSLVRCLSWRLSCGLLIMIRRI